MTYQTIEVKGGFFVSALSGGPQNRQRSAVAFSALGRGDADPSIGVRMALRGVVFFIACVSCASFRASLLPIRTVFILQL